MTYPSILISINVSTKKCRNPHFIKADNSKYEIIRGRIVLLNKSITQYGLNRKFARLKLFMKYANSCIK